ncbi:hypothetical protein CCP3SC1AL1_1380009 [Gammaproteobacteria bacterium]
MTKMMFLTINVHGIAISISYVYNQKNTYILLILLILTFVVLFLS